MTDGKKICLTKGCEHFIVPREEWGASPAAVGIEKNRYQEAFTSVYTGIVVHYSGFPPDWTPNRVQSYFQQKRGYDDIGVHYYIAGNGSIYEGRSLVFIGAHAGQSIEANAAHDIKKDPDYGMVGIEVAGCFDKGCLEQFTPTAEQRAALGALILFLYKKLPNIKQDNVMGHTEVYEKIMKPAGMTPRREDNNTVCPGGELMKWVEEIRAKLPKR